MRKRALGIVAAIGLACAAWHAAPGSAAPSPYTRLILHVNATSTLTLVLVQDAGACTLTGTGTNAASLDLGTGDAFSGTSCATFTAATNYKFKTTFSVEASCSGTCATKFQLSAALAAATSGVTTKLGSTNLTTTAQNIGGTIAYNTAKSKSFTVTVSSVPPPSSGTIPQTIEFTATDNCATAPCSTATATLAVSFVNDLGFGNHNHAFQES